MGRVYRFGFKRLAFLSPSDIDQNKKPYPNSILTFNEYFLLDFNDALIVYTRTLFFCWLIVQRQDYGL